MQHFDTNWPYQKTNISENRMKIEHQKIEWGIAIAKYGVLPVTTLFFWKFSFSIRTSYKESIWCTNYPNVHIHTFCKRMNLISDCFSDCFIGIYGFTGLSSFCKII